MIRNRRNVCRVRRWGAGVGLAGGAVAAAVIVGIGAAPAAYADANTDVFDQAAADLVQASSLLDSAPTASLDADYLKILDSQESLITGLAPTVARQESLQDSLPAADQSSSLLAAADQNYLHAYDELLSADQAFVAADQAGDFTGQASSLSGSLAVLGVLNADLGLIPANIDLDFADVVVKLAGDFGLYF